MAFPSPWRWSCRCDSVIQCSSSSSIFFEFNLRKTTRRNSSYRLITLSLDSSSSPSNGSIHKRTRKSIECDKFTIRALSDPKNVNSQTLSSKKRRAVWRRILFASNKVRSLILLNVLTIVYASNVPVVKEVEEIVDPALFTVVRFTMSAVPFIPFIFKARDDVETRNAGIELGFWVSLGYLMQALGLLTSEAGRASFLSMFTVIVVPLLDGMLGAIVPSHTWFGAVMSIIGVAMLESSGSPPIVGDLLNFLSAVFFGVHMLRTEHISRNTSKDNFLPLLGYEISVVSLFSIIWYFIGCWAGDNQLWERSSWTWKMFWDWMIEFPWIPAIYTGIFSTGLCLWVEMAAMCDVSATETAIIYGLEPVWGAAFAWFLLGERWGTMGWIGAALVLVGSLTVQICSLFSPNNSGEDVKGTKKGDDNLLLLDKSKTVSTSPVVVKSRKDVTDLLKLIAFHLLVMLYLSPNE
ncbi:EamA domain, partial [Dillenia turbinata]